MIAPKTALRRRHVLTTALAAAALAPSQDVRAQLALAEVLGLEKPTLIVAGPDDSDTGYWARVLRPALSAGLVAGSQLLMRYVGGQDGVTGANQFDARATPDGSQALLFPGRVVLACMAGDSRVRFNAASMTPLLAVVSPGLVMLRSDLAGRPARVACGGDPDQGAVALLGLDLIGVRAMPVRVAAGGYEAVRRGLADAVFLCGQNTRAQSQSLLACGLQPAFGLPGGGMAFNEPTSVPALGDIMRRGPRGDGALMTAWLAMADSYATPLALTLPAMSPASAVARWRRACATSLADPDVLDATGGSVRLLADTEAAGALRATRADAASQVALRQWLHARLNWRAA